MNTDIMQYLVAHPIIVAIYFRRPACLQTLLNAYSSFLASHQNSNEMAHCAIDQIDGSPSGTETSEKIIEMLLATREGKASFDKKPFQITPLMYCLYKFGDCCESEASEEDRKRQGKREEALEKIVERLIKSGVSLSHRVMDLPLATACSKNVKPEITSLLLEYGANPNDFMGHNGFTCFSSVLDESYADGVKLLLENGPVDVNGKGPCGLSPFNVTYCLRAKDKACLKTLTDLPTLRLDCTELQEAKSDLTKEQLLTPEEKHYSYLPANLKKKNDGKEQKHDQLPALLEAALENRVDKVKHLCAIQDTDVNLGESVTGTTALHLMAERNNIDMLEVILGAHSANENAVNAFGAGPLHYAAKTNAKEATECLVYKGALVDMRCTIMGNTPLHVAAACNSMEVAKLLIKNGAQVNAQNKYQETPLCLAAMTGSKEVLLLLLDNEAVLNAKNIHGQTPLYLALNYQEYKIAKILVNKGANIMAREKYWNQTILHHAVTMGNVDMVEFLISKGADKEAKDSKGYTPFLRCGVTRPYEKKMWRQEEVDYGKLARRLLELGCDVTAKLDEGPVFNLLNLIMHNKNTLVLQEFITKCPNTNKFQVDPLLDKLPKGSKMEALDLWEHVSKEHPGELCCDCHCPIYRERGWR